MSLENERGCTQKIGKSRKRMKQSCQIDGCPHIVFEEASKMKLALCQIHFEAVKIGENYEIEHVDTNTENNGTHTLENTNGELNNDSSPRNESQKSDIEIDFTAARCDKEIAYPNEEVFNKKCLPHLSNQIEALPFQVDSGNIYKCKVKNTTLLYGSRIRDEEMTIIKNKTSWFNDNMVQILLHW